MLLTLFHVDNIVQNESFDTFHSSNLIWVEQKTTSSKTGFCRTEVNEKKYKTLDFRSQEHFWLPKIPSHLSTRSLYLVTLLGRIFRITRITPVTSLPYLHNETQHVAYGS